jgi:zinc/manganese transport system permease protein
MLPADPGPSGNLITDLRLLWSYPFMVNAFRAGTIIAVVTGAIGWFMVLRRQSFAGHTLAVAGFPGAAGATLAGIPAGYGYFGFCVAAALVIAAVPRGRAAAGAGSAVTGTVQAAALACGYLFVALYKGFLNGVNALLFGSFLGITTGQVALLGLVGLLAVAVLVVFGRPLLLASIDPDGAAARGVPVRTLSVGFLVLLGVAVAEASQITGTLLVFALLVMPAATAQVISAHPALSLGITLVIAVTVTWLALGVAFFTPYPIGFWVTTIAFAGYVTALGLRLGARKVLRSR